jgi:ABC-2 type transport system permease protein
MQAIQARALTWWTILRICLEERLVYRGDFALATLVRFLPIVTQIFLWGSIFTVVPNQNGMPGKIAGYTFHNFIAYYLLSMVARAFSSMPGLSSGIARDIRDGTVKKFLIQPIDMIGFLFLMRVAHKLVYYGVAIGPFPLVFYLCRGFFPPVPDALTITAFVLSLLMSFMIGFFLEAAIGLAGFWFLEINSLMWIYMLFNFFFSGHMFPLNMLPGTLSTFVQLQPLQYLAFFPAAVWLGTIKDEALMRGLLLELFWVVFFFLLCRFAYARGVRRYSGFGG